MPGRRSVFIGLAESQTDELVYDRYAIVDLARITRLEPLERAGVNGGNA